jgi:hypothetical protein
VTSSPFARAVRFSAASLCFEHSKRGSHDLLDVTKLTFVGGDHHLRWTAVTTPTVSTFVRRYALPKHPQPPRRCRRAGFFQRWPSPVGADKPRTPASRGDKRGPSTSQRRPVPRQLLPHDRHTKMISRIIHTASIAEIITHLHKQSPAEVRCGARDSVGSPECPGCPAHGTQHRSGGS